MARPDRAGQYLLAVASREFAAVVLSPTRQWGDASATAALRCDRTGALERPITGGHLTRHRALGALTIAFGLMALAPSAASAATRSEYDNQADAQRSV